MSVLKVDHVRRPALPWREATYTECGRPLPDVSSWITREDVLERVAQWGKQRTSLHTCMTCWETASRWPVFDDDPVMSMYREVYQGLGRHPDLAVELRALAALAIKYRQEFDEFVVGHGRAVSLADARRARARRAR